MDLKRIKTLENEIISGLKDFQKATVDRIYELFSNGEQEKVLVADEVGLGKTLVAKGIISRMARLHKEIEKDSFQVVYICSNLNIAQQNMGKLRIGEEVKVDRKATRLSMQALRIFEQQEKLKEENGFIQLTAMTPGTSFRLTRGAGEYHERAFIYVVLSKTGLFDNYLQELDYYLSMEVKSWASARSEMEERVENLGEQFKRKVIARIRSYLIEETPEFFSDLKFKVINYNIDDRFTLIGRLRWIMAYLSLEFLNPDLVIMDEFQRFRDLIAPEKDSEMEMLTQKFIHTPATKTLLLSATPYKLYSTLEEIEYKNNRDDHYEEFWEVMGFLFQDKEQLYEQLQQDWDIYSKYLRIVDSIDLNSIADYKEKVEDILYKAICRTERLKVSETGEAMLETKKAGEPVKVTENDIKSYIEAAKVMDSLKEYQKNVPQPIEYVKSSPYIFSFMDHYKLKEEMKKAYQNNPELEKSLKNSKICWLKRSDLNKYKRIQFPNARLRQLEQEAFSNNGAYLLWVPPSLPYYEPGGPFRQAEGFSKILVFSAWAMVPRMISTLISYEAERRTIGTPSYKSETSWEGRKLYFAKEKRRFPYPKLKFKAQKQAEQPMETRPESMSLFTILYPSPTFSVLFSPIEVLNGFSQNGEKISLKNIEQNISNKLSPELNRIKSKHPPVTGKTGTGWYWAAPFLIDIANGYGEVVSKWINMVIEQKKEAIKNHKRENPEIKHLHFLQKIAQGEVEVELGPMPEDLPKVLAWQVLASPAICTLRTIMNGEFAQEYQEYLPFFMREAYNIGNKFMGIFNRPEATAIVDILYGKKYEGQYWRNVLRYCVDGNLQSVLDEYRHMLVESHGLWYMNLPDQALNCSRLILEAMEISTASYKVDTLDAFLDNFNENKKLNLRSHYATGFFDVKSYDEKNTQRTGRLRSSFNSPFRPFVLATTSIGQEGLDFHYYCRKVMHWNLPSNPVELEQREGRVNRYKNIAIRKNVAAWYSNIIFSKDPWNEMFTKCRQQLEDYYCELTPYWHLESENNQNNYVIERIVAKYPYSRDEQNYERLIRLLSLYRISLGQARQEELLEYILQNFKDDELEEIKNLFMNLSPYYRSYNLK